MHPPETPAALGYRMPAEWEPHRATWLSWPHNPETWPGRMAPVPAIWARLVGALVPGEEVHILVRDRSAEDAARAVLAQAGVRSERVVFHWIRTNDAWMRDHGPTFLVGRDAGDLAMVDWKYNAWGGKYPPWDNDDRVPSRINQQLGLPIFRPGIVLEGGSIDVNGAGTLMTTESCLLNPNRNPELGRAELERILADHLAVSHFVWLAEGVAGDDTDGHIDDLARFVSADKVVTVIEDDAADSNYRPLLENLNRLEQARDQDGRALEVVTLPMPPPISVDGQRVPASYANFYIANDAVIVPVFGCDEDDRALSILQECFPERAMVAIDAVDLVYGLGAFHCITQQQPA